MVNQVIQDVVERLKNGAPTSVVVTEPGRGAVSFTSELVKYIKASNNLTSLLPISIKCSNIDCDEIGYWKAVYNGIWKVLQPYCANNRDTLELYAKGIETSDNMLKISKILGRFLITTNNSTNIRVLLILEDFDSMVYKLEEPAIMILRGITPLITVLTISNKTLEELGLERYGNAYYCNQFTPPPFYI